MKFTPAKINAKRGETIRFVVRSAGQVKHEMVIGSMAELKEHAELMRKMPGMEHAEPNQVTLAPGKTRDLVWQFTKSGAVDFACLVPGHFEAGMTGKVSNRAPKMKRMIAILVAAILGLSVSIGALAQPTVIEVYQSPYCGCCSDWIKHLQQNRYTVKVHEVMDASAYRAKFGVPDQLGSCHTAMVEGYAIEGHVPAREITRLLAEKPKAKGLAVPAMPRGSPGMEGPISDPYEVLLFQADGRYKVYQKYGN